MNELAVNNDVSMYILNEATNIASILYIYYLIFINILFAF